MSYRIIQDLNETDPPKEHEKQAARIRNFMQSGDAHIKKLLIIEKGGEVVDYSVLKR